MNECTIIMISDIHDLYIIFDDTTIQYLLHPLSILQWLKSRNITPKNPIQHPPKQNP